MDKDSTRRRRPRQERSQKRVASILGAAAELLEEIGYTALTTNAIAAKAGTSIGSLYQFFPNKDAVVAELVKALHGQLRDFFANSLTVEMARRSAAGLVETLVDGLEEIQRRTPGFGMLFTNAWLGEPVEKQVVQLERDIIAPLNDLLAKAYPEVDAKQRRLCMQVVTETTKVLMSKVANEDEATQAAMREELKLMLGLYLASRFPPPKTAAKPAAKKRKPVRKTKTARRNA